MNSHKTMRGLRPRLAAVLVSGALVVIGLGAPARGQDDFIAGSGNSYAQVFRVGPTAARLSLAPVIGLSLADYLDTAGRAQASVADWAAIGVAEPALPDNTPNVRVVSTQKNADKGTRRVVIGGTDGSGNGGGVFDLYARATKAPFGESSFDLAHFLANGLVEIHGGHAFTSSGIVERAGKMVRESRAVVTIEDFSFAGAIELTGLRWEAVQQTSDDAGRKVSGSFTIGGASIGGSAIPLPVESGDIKSVLEPLNNALAPTGFGIVPPEVSKDGGLAEVSPLAIQVVNSSLGRQFLAPLLADLQPIRQPITAELIKRFQEAHQENSDFPDLTVGILAADLTVGVLSGSSQAHIELGGAEAYTEGQRFENPFNFLSPNLTARSAGPETIFVPGRPGRPAIPGTIDQLPGNPNAELAAALPSERTIPGRKGGVAVAVGIAGLAAALGLAAADWYRMRKSRQASA